MTEIFVIVGPTCVGKTSAALDLCKNFGGEIVSADSRQIYKLMDIGTGKMPMEAGTSFVKKEAKWVVGDVNIWGYDLVEPGKYFSAYDYAAWALPKLKELLASKVKVFLVGGTGFYVDVVTGRRTLEVASPDFVLRQNLEVQATEDLFLQLAVLNEEAAKRIDKFNRRRLIRALEKALTGNASARKPLSYLKEAAFKFIGFDGKREFLYERADKWVDAVWRKGLLEETKVLMEAGYSESPQLNGLIYKSARAHLNGELSEDDALQRAKYDLHAYIRRQQTYFKLNKEIIWLDIQDPDFSASLQSLVL